MSLPDTAPLLLAAMLLDAVVGDPRWLYRVVPHPTVIMGRVLSFCDGRLNRPGWSAVGRRAAGAVSTVAVMASFGLLAALISAGLSGWRIGFWVEALLVSALIAQNSLYRHVADVARALERDGVDAGRSAVAHIVGRDPESLDAHGVARGAVESLAENFSDGVVAPVLVGSAPRPAGHRGLQGPQHRRQHDRPPRPPLPRFRMGGGATGRHRQLGAGAGRRIPVGRLRRAIRARPHGSRPEGHVAARRAPTARSTPAIRRAPWPACWACAWPDRAGTGAS